MAAKNCQFNRQIFPVWDIPITNQKPATSKIRMESHELFQTPPLKKKHQTPSQIPISIFDIGTDMFVNEIFTYLSVPETAMLERVCRQFRVFVFKILTELQINSPNFTRKSLEGLSKYSSLISLSLFTSSLTNNDIPLIGNLFSLKILHLQCPFPKCDISWLTTLIHLKSLTLQSHQWMDKHSMGQNDSNSKSQD
jgi:hypothetical protein